MNIKKIFKDDYCLIIFFIWSLWVSIEFLLGPYAHIRIADSGMGGVGGIPELLAVKKQVQEYGISYFGNFLPGGVDLASNLHLPFSHLNSLLFFIFPGPFAYGLLMFVQRFVASYFTFRLCRDSLKLTFWPSFFAGIAYSLFNYSIFNFTTFHQLSEPGIPFFLWAIDRLDYFRNVYKYILAIILGLFWGFTTYLPYGVPIFIPITTIWFIYIVKKNRYSFWIIILLITSTSIAIQIPQIWSLILNAPSSMRVVRLLLPGYKFFTSYLYDVWNSVYEFKLQLLIILSGLLFIKKVFKNVLILRIFILSSLLIIISPLFSSLKNFLPDIFEFAKTFQFSRYNIIAPFFLTLISATILNIFLKANKYNSKFKLTIFLCILIIIFIESIKIKVETILNYAPYRTLYEIPDLISLYNNDKSVFRVASISGGGLRPAYAYSYGLETVDGYLALYPKSYYDFWGKVIAKRLSNDTYNKYEDYITYGSRIYLYGPENFDNFKFIDFQKYFDLTLLSSANVKYIISRIPLRDDNLILLPSEHRNSITNWNEFSKIGKLYKFLKGKYYGPEIYIYENKRVLPRFFVRRNEEIITDEVAIEKYSPDEIRLSLNLSDDALLVSSINYYPFWSAFVNDKKREVNKNENGFIIIDIHKGDNYLTLKYSPPYAFF